MSRKAFIPKPKDGRKEASRNGDTNTDPALDMTRTQEVREMPVDRQYNDSARLRNSQLNMDTPAPLFNGGAV